MSPSVQQKKQVAAPPNLDLAKARIGNRADATTRRCERLCRQMEKELSALIPQVGAKEESVLSQLAVETIQLGNQFALFRERVRSTKLPPKGKSVPQPPVVL